MKYWANASLTLLGFKSFSKFSSWPVRGILSRPERRYLAEERGGFDQIDFAYFLNAGLISKETWGDAGARVLVEGHQRKHPRLDPRLGSAVTPPGRDSRSNPNLTNKKNKNKIINTRNRNAHYRKKEKAIALVHLELTTQWRIWTTYITHKNTKKRWTWIPSTTAKNLENWCDTGELEKSRSEMENAELKGRKAEKRKLFNFTQITDLLKIKRNGRYIQKPDTYNGRKLAKKTREPLSNARTELHSATTRSLAWRLAGRPKNIARGGTEEKNRALSLADRSSPPFVAGHLTLGMPGQRPSRIDGR